MIFIKKAAYLAAILMVLAIIVSFLNPAEAAQLDKAYDWCYKPNNTHTPPTVMDGNTFFKPYDVIYRKDTDEKVIYLTFDAGYDKGTHSKILDVLKKHNIPAVFFFDGNMLKRFPEIVKRAVSEGHIIGNHTLNHPDMTKYAENKAKYFNQIEEWNNLYRNITQTEPVKIMRFPMGRFSERTLIYNKELGYSSVFWSFAYFDYEDDNQPSVSTAVDTVLERLHSGAVLLLHSTSVTNANALEEIILKVQNEGYRFGSFYELLI